jgi:hypothetical protein
MDKPQNGGADWTLSVEMRSNLRLIFPAQISIPKLIAFSAFDLPLYWDEIIHKSALPQFAQTRISFTLSRGHQTTIWTETLRILG